MLLCLVAALVPGAGVDPEPPLPMKVIASVEWREASRAPRDDYKHQVVRSASELLDVVPVQARRAARGQAEKRVEQEAATRLKVKRIDWDRQMLLVLGGAWRSAHVIEVVAVKKKGDTLTVSWRPVVTKGGEYKYYSSATVALVPRVSGKVVFEQVK